MTQLWLKSEQGSDRIDGIKELRALFAANGCDKKARCLDMFRHLRDGILGGWLVWQPEYLKASKDQRATGLRGRLCDEHGMMKSAEDLCIIPAMAELCGIAKEDIDIVTAAYQELKKHDVAQIKAKVMSQPWFRENSAVQAWFENVQWDRVVTSSEQLNGLLKRLHDDNAGHGDGKQERVYICDVSGGGVDKRPFFLVDWTLLENLRFECFGEPNIQLALQYTSERLDLAKKNVIFCGCDEKSVHHQQVGGGVGTGWWKAEIPGFSEASKGAEGDKETSVEEAVRKLTELDAAGWAVVVLRCDRESEIRRVVEGYRHAAGSERKAEDETPMDGLTSVKVLNMHEATACSTVKDYHHAFRTLDHAQKSPGKTGNILVEWLERGLLDFDGKVVNGDPNHRLLFIPDFEAIFGTRPEDGRPRAADAQQCIFVLHELARQKRQGLGHSLVVVGCTNETVSPDLLECAYVVDVQPPKTDELKRIIREACRECGGTANGLTTANVNRLVAVMRGMCREDVRNIVNLAYSRHELPLENDAQELYDVALDAKRQRIEGVLGLKWIEAGHDEVGGLENLKAWLRVRGAAFNAAHAAERCQVPLPKGVLVVGLPGCGKTYLAKNAARILSGDEPLRVPLLQMDLGAMLSKWYGEAEKNFHKAIRMVTNVSPCVLLVDEIEKLFDQKASGDDSAGRRIFAALLDWLQENKSVLVIGTANRVDLLPPELKRKGRFDEIFFTGIPTERDCRRILLIHLKRKESAFDANLKKELYVFDRLMNYDDGEKVWQESGIHWDILEDVMHAAAGERRFLTGADIEAIVGAAFSSLFANLDAKERADLDGDRDGDGCEAASRCYDRYQVFAAIKSEMKQTRTFFDSNLDDVATYWLMMHQLSFRNAGACCLLDPVKYDFDEDAGRFEGLVSKKTCRDDEYEDKTERESKRASEEKRYDDALRYRLAGRIFRLVQEKRQGVQR